MHKAVCRAFAGLVLAAPVAIGAQDTTQAPRADTAAVQRVDTVATVDTVAQLARPDRMRRFSVTPVIGTISWDDASALANKAPEGSSGEFTKRVYTPTIGLSANYNIIPQFGVGAYFEAARPETRGDYFPAAYFTYGENVQLTTVSQRVTVMMYGLQAQGQLTFNRFEPFVSAGFGGVTVNTDAQQNDGNTNTTNTSAQIGGGVAYQMGIGSIVLDLRDFVFFDWERERLNAVDPAFQNTTIPGANLTAPAPKSTVHNFRIAIGFSFVPRFGGGSADTGDEDDTDEGGDQ